MFRYALLAHLKHQVNTHLWLQVYHPGETINGAVEFTLTVPKHYDCIKLKFLGSANVRWNIGKTSYVGQETYIQESLLLWSPQQSSSGMIGPGSFSFPFRFIIPPHVPSSFVFHDRMNAFGDISYKIEARAVTGVFRFDHTASAKILILRLTSISGANQTAPVQEVKRKQVGCLCCAAGDVEFIAKLPRTGYCVTNHDIIPLTVNVQNNSTRMIKMKAKIIQQVTLTVRSQSDVLNKTMAKTYSEIIQPGASYVWNPTNLIVPHGLPPTLLGCRIL